MSGWHPSCTSGLPQSWPVALKVIRRHAGHDGRFPFGVEHEKLGVGPDVRGIARDENRNVADDADTAFVGVFLDVLPLAIKEELAELVRADR